MSAYPAYEIATEADAAWSRQMLEMLSVRGAIELDFSEYYIDEDGS